MIYSFPLIACVCKFASLNELETLSVSGVIIEQSLQAFRLRQLLDNARTNTLILMTVKSKLN